MNAVFAYAAAHWVEWLFTACLGILSFAWRSVAKRQKDAQEKSNAIADGVQCLLRENIIQSYNRYSDKGYCPIYAKESIKMVYHAYHALGGNDLATGLYVKLLDMPTDKEVQNES
mgnify:CR=1 FL=1